MSRRPMKNNGPKSRTRYSDQVRGIPSRSLSITDETGIRTSGKVPCSYEIHVRGSTKRLINDFSHNCDKLGLIPVLQQRIGELIIYHVHGEKADIDKLIQRDCILSSSPIFNIRVPSYGSGAGPEKLKSSSGKSRDDTKWKEYLESVPECTFNSVQVQGNSTPIPSERSADKGKSVHTVEMRIPPKHGKRKISFPSDKKESAHFLSEFHYLQSQAHFISGNDCPVLDSYYDTEKPKKFLTF